MRTGVRFIGKILSFIDTQALMPVRNRFAQWISLPIYRVFFFTQLRIRKTVASTRGLFFVFFTSKYTMHILLVAFAIPIAFAELKPASAAADVGQRSILYALVTNGQDSVIEESANQYTQTSIVTSSYLPETVQAAPHIDYDYAIGDESDPTTDYGIAGTVAMKPQPTNLPTDSSTGETQEPVFASADELTADNTQDVVVRSSEVSTYTVRAGDTLAVIARRNGITVGTILWANNLKVTSPLHPGDTLKILPVSGVMHTVKTGDTLAGLAKKYAVALSDIQEANPTLTTVKIGASILIPGGQPLPSSPTVVAAATKPATTAANKTTTATVTTKSPKVTSATDVRTDVPIARIKDKAFDVYQELSDYTTDDRSTAPAGEEDLPPPTSKLLWPTVQRLINQYYGWNHTGVDINGDYTDVIYASADGVVKEAGWNSGGYGLQVVIDHAGGLRTRYAHSSKLFVKVGDEVKRGEVIGYVGTTGRSTGTHLHYEVYTNGKRVNPLSYIK